MSFGQICYVTLSLGVHDIWSQLQFTPIALQWFYNFVFDLLVPTELNHYSWLK